MNGKDWKKEALALVVLLRAKCSDEEWANMESRFAAATPQVTPTEGNFCTGDQDCRHTCEPCDHFWRTVAVSPRWSWFTECEKCKIGAPLELQAENYVEGTSEQASPDPFSKGYKHREGKPVSDACGEGRHAECTQDLTKCHCTFRTGHTVLHAYMNPKLASEQASPTPEKCPTCKSPMRDFLMKKYADPVNLTMCDDSWHSGEVERG